MTSLRLDCKVLQCNFYEVTTLLRLDLKCVQMFRWVQLGTVSISMFTNPQHAIFTAWQASTHIFVTLLELSIGQFTVYKKSVQCVMVTV